MPGENYYKILGLTSSASDALVKKRYRELAKKFHPDKNKDENSTKIFQEIKDAYEHILNRDFTSTKKDTSPTQKTPEQKFHEDAWKRAEQQKKQEAEELLLFYDSFRIGWKKKLVTIVAILGTICILGLVADDFLPLRKSIEIVKDFSANPSHSLGNDYVYEVKFRNGETLWLNHQDIHKLDNLPPLIIAKTSIFHQPVYVESKSVANKIRTNIHFTFYWAQAVLFIFFLLPIVIYFYKRNDVFFVLGNYLTFTISSSLLLLFLLNDLKIIHLLTLGYY
jgi:hypothetical protein